MKNTIFPQNNPDLLLGDYRLPITVVDADLMTHNDLTAIDAMRAVMPATRLREGAIVRPIDDRVKSVRGRPLGYYWGLWRYNRERLASVGAPIPQLWKVRHVLSSWAYGIIGLLQEGEVIHGTDHAAAMLDTTGEEDWGSAMVYAHGWPGAFNPNTACWWDPDVLRVVPLKDFNTEVWPTILDESHTHFRGYPSVSGNLAIDLAPDAYGLGQRLKNPFKHEEEGVHTACLLGYEEALMVPLSGSRVVAPKRAAISRIHQYEDLIDDIV